MQDTKVCGKCKQTFTIDKFGKRTSSKDGLDYYCKKCNKDYDLQYRKINRDSLLEKQKLRESRLEGKLRKRQYYENNKEDIKAYHSRWYKNNKNRILDQTKNYRVNNKDKAIIRYNRKMATDPEYRISFSIRARFKNALKDQNAIKLRKTFSLIGCSVSELRKYLESLFFDGMSWENYGRGGWVIDHIIPCASFNLLVEKEQEKCFHWSNLRPLWEFENISKGSWHNGKRIRRGFKNA